MIYLCQTDTTAGFCSQNLAKINKIKNRDLNQPCLITVSRYEILKAFSRVPQKYKNIVRRSKKTTFLYPNSKAIRVVKDCKHTLFLDEIKWVYSSSANLHSKNFDLDYAKKVADIVVDNYFFESSPSKIFKISKNNIKKIR